MHQSEEPVKQDIVTADGEEEFQVRYIRSEQVGVVTSRSGKSWFILDSKDYWYDLIQEEYPTRKKCNCKNDFFRLSFAYTPRINTEDYRSVSLSAHCTACGKEKKLGAVEIDYSPSAHLYTQPLTFCPEPKLKCRTYTIQGYWTDTQLSALSAFLLEKKAHLYSLYFNREEKKRYVREITAEELRHTLSDWRSYICIYFSWEPLEPYIVPLANDGRGAFVKDIAWRKAQVLKLSSPFLVAGKGYLHSMYLSSEYIAPDGSVQPKSEAFSQLIQEFRVYCQQLLR